MDGTVCLSAHIPSQLHMPHGEEPVFRRKKVGQHIKKQQNQDLGREGGRERDFKSQVPEICG